MYGRVWISLALLVVLSMSLTSLAVSETNQQTQVGRLVFDISHWTESWGGTAYTSSPYIKLPKAVVVFTFDEGYTDLYEYAYPILKERGFVGSVLLRVGCIGKTNCSTELGLEDFMTWEQVRELYLNGWDIMSHSVTHTNLVGLSEEQLIYELAESKSMIYEKGIDVVGFAYPYGSKNDTVIQYTRKYYLYGRSATTTGVFPYILGKAFDVNTFAFDNVRNATDLINVLDNKIIPRKTALVVMMHHVLPEYGDYITNVQEFETFVDYVKQKVDEGVVEVLTLRDLLLERIRFLIHELPEYIPDELYNASTPPELLAMYIFEEGGGSTLVDSSQYGQNLTIYGNASWVDGEVGKGIYFDGTVEINGTVDFNFGNEMTLVIVFNVTQMADSFLVTTSPNSFYLFLKSHGALEFMVGNVSTSVYLNTDYPKIEPNKTYFVVCQYNGTHMKIYVNGLLVSILEIDIGDIYNPSTLYIGAKNGAYPFQGVIEHIEIYNKTVPIEEIMKRFIWKQLNWSFIVSLPYYSNVTNVTLGYVPEGANFSWNAVPIYNNATELVSGNGKYAKYWNITISVPEGANLVPLLVPITVEYGVMPEVYIENTMFGAEVLDFQFSPETKVAGATINTTSRYSIAIMNTSNYGKPTYVKRLDMGEFLTEVDLFEELLNTTDAWYYDSNTSMLYIKVEHYSEVPIEVSWQPLETTATTTTTTTSPPPEAPETPWTTYLIIIISVILVIALFLMGTKAARHVVYEERRYVKRKT